MGDEVPAELVASLEATALDVRRDIVRQVFATGSGHPGGSLSAADLLTALVFRELRIDPARPDWPDRDRLVLSKWHAAPALYSTLALRGFFPREGLLLPEPQLRPGVDATPGGPGEGVGLAVGMALSARLDHRPSRVAALVGDGECQSGGLWEALLVGAQHRLENLLIVVDRNGFQGDGATESILGLEPLVEKFRAFGYRTVEIDGHDFREILGALAAARSATAGPSAIVARTVKGKGVSFMQNTHVWHGRVPSKDEAERALIELGVPPAEAAR